MKTQKRVKIAAFRQLFSGSYFHPFLCFHVIFWYSTESSTTNFMIPHGSTWFHMVPHVSIRFQQDFNLLKGLEQHPKVFSFIDIKIPDLL